VTVTWTVKAVEEWCKRAGGISDKVFREANERFGRWMHSVSYKSCFELWRMAEEYLKEKHMDAYETLDITGFFCGALEKEIEYDRYVYGLLKETLAHIMEKCGEADLGLHAKSLIELVATAEKLKSNILCSG
jgi:hypothetical protein